MAQTSPKKPLSKSTDAGSKNTPASDALDVEIQTLPVGQLRHLEVNARYMTASQQARLTANIKRDGGLTSLPLVWLMQDEDGRPHDDPPAYEIVSGNHRVRSAREAGLTEISCIVIKNWVSSSRRVEIQLAHNAVGGQDDLSVLETLYEGLDLSGKEYSGLTDDAFKGLKDLSLTGFSVEGPDYQEIVLSFLPDDAEQFTAAVARAEKRKDALTMVGELDAFNGIFDAIVSVKESLNIQNNAIALRALARLATERLDQMEQDDDEAERVSTGGGG